MRVLACVVLAACGRVGFDARGDAAPADAASCVTWSAFSAPVVLPGPVNSTEDDWSPTPADGELELYFFSYRVGPTAALYRAERSNPAGAFAAATAVTELNTGANDGTPTVTADDLDIIYNTDATGTGDLYEATRASPTDLFGTPQPVASLNTAANPEADPFVSADGLRIMFTSSRAGGLGGMDIYEATRVDRSTPFGAIVSHVELDSPADEYSPTLSADGLEIIFASARNGGFGDFDIYTARRGALDQPFSNVVQVPELSSPLDDVGTRLAPDGATLYFDYDTLTTGGANADMWTATRTCLESHANAAGD